MWPFSSCCCFLWTGYIPNSTFDGHIFSNPGFAYYLGRSTVHCSMVEQETSSNLMESHAYYQSLNFVPWRDKAICLLPMGIKPTLSGNEDPFVYDLAIKNVLFGFLSSIIFHSIVTEWGGHNSQSNRAGQHTQYGYAESSTILQCHIWEVGFIV